MKNSTRYWVWTTKFFDGNKVSNFDNYYFRCSYSVHCHVLLSFCRCIKPRLRLLIFVLYDDGWYFMSRRRSVGKVNFWHSVSLAYLRPHCQLWGDKTNERIQMGRYYVCCKKNKIKHVGKIFIMLITRCWVTLWK